VSGEKELKMRKFTPSELATIHNAVVDKRRILQRKGKVIVAEDNPQNAMALIEVILEMQEIDGILQSIVEELGDPKETTVSSDNTISKNRS
jgi:hypothetical protein